MASRSDSEVAPLLNTPIVDLLSNLASMAFYTALFAPANLLSAAGCFLLYVLGLYAYRLLFHPLAKFPGPKLAAISNWYEFYWDVLQHGKFTEHIQALHKQYGTSTLKLGSFSAHTIFRLVIRPFLRRLS